MTSISICVFCDQEKDNCCVWQEHYQLTGNEEWKSDLFKERVSNLLESPDIRSNFYEAKRDKFVNMNEDDTDSFDWFGDFGIESIKLN